METKNYRIGETKIMNNGMKATIIHYEKATNIDIKFEDGTIVKNKRYSSFKTGNILNPNLISLCDIGYIGQGKYHTTKDNKLTKEYQVWSDMIKRCCSNKFIKKYPSYKDCTVCEEWHNFQNFAEWYNENYYEADNENMCLDKDILVKGNKVYSPETCIFVPQFINNLFPKCDSARGKHLIGVTTKQDSNKYFANCSINNKLKKKRIYLGAFETELEAFETYKQFKENYIKQIADEYKDKIPKKLYNAMYNYKVEITD